MKKNIILASFAIAMFSTSISAKEVSAFAYHEVGSFINDFAKEGLYTKNQLIDIFARTKIKQEIKKQDSKQPERILTWETYRNKVVTKEKIQQGKSFVQNNSVYLNKAEQQYGVPKEIITSIIGIESFYGKYKGDHKAINAISTMAFEGSKRRQTFFQSELKAYLTYTYKNKLDPLKIKSSWAGAFGYPQFISSSILHYGVDFDKNGKIDLFNSIPDAIGSVANYLSKSGWIKDNYIAMKVKNPKNAKLDYSGINLLYTVNQLKLKGIIFPDNMRGTKESKIFKLKNNNNSFSYWVGFENFKAITLYNRSNLYAMAVFELANDIHGSVLK